MNRVSIINLEAFDMDSFDFTYSRVIRNILDSYIFNGNMVLSIFFDDYKTYKLLIITIKGNAALLLQFGSLYEAEGAACIRCTDGDILSNKIFYVLTVDIMVITA